MVAATAQAFPGPTMFLSAPRQAATTLTIDEMPQGYGGSRSPSFSNLTISGTTVTDAASGFRFVASMKGNSLNIGGVNYAIATAGTPNANTCTLVVAPGNGTGIAGYFVTGGSIVNRAPGATGTQGRIVRVTGTYTGNAPSAIDFRLVYSLVCVIQTPGAVFQDYTAVGGLSASAGVWSGLIYLPKCPDWIVVNVRDNTNTAVVSNAQALYWGVGVIASTGFGQSNEAKCFGAGTELLINSQDSRTRLYAHAGWAKLYTPAPGPPAWGFNVDDFAIRLANEIANVGQCLVGIIPFNCPATFIKQFLTFANGGFPDNDTQNVWFNTGANGGQFGASGDGLTAGTLAGVNSVMLYAHDFEVDLQQLGEQDGGGGGSAATYQAMLDTFFNTQLLQVTGRSYGQLKVCLVPLGTFTLTQSASFTGSLNTVRQAQLQWIHDNPTVAIYGGTVQDASHNNTKGGDSVHWATSYGWDDEEIMKRYTQALLQAFGFQAQGAAGPQIASAAWSVGTSTLTITVTQDRGTALVDTSGSSSGTGFKAFAIVLNGSPIVPTTVQITGANTITCTMPSNRPAGQTCTLTHGAGPNPAQVIQDTFANLSAAQNATTVTDSSSQGFMDALMTGASLVVASGTNFTPGTYPILSAPTINSIVVSVAPATTGAGSAGVGSITSNMPPQYIYDNASFGVLYASARGFPLQPTLGAITVT